MIILVAHQMIISKCFWLRGKVPRFFRSWERKFHHIFASWNESLFLRQQFLPAFPRCD